MPSALYTHVQAALDALTGPVGGNVAVTLLDEDPEAPIRGVVVDRVVVGDRLEAIVVDVDHEYTGGYARQYTRRTSIPWANVRTLTRTPEASS